MIQIIRDAVWHIAIRFRRKPPCPAASGAVALALGIFPVVAMAQPVLLATHQYDGSLSVVDANNFRVLGNLPISNGPKAVAVHPNGKYAFVANRNGSDTGCGGNVLVVDIDAVSVVDCVQTEETGANLVDIAVGPSGTDIFVLRADSKSSILKIAFDPANPTEARWLDSIPLSQALGTGIPQRLSVHPDGIRLYVSVAGTNRVFEVTTCSPRCNRVTGFFPVGGFPQGMAISPEGRTLYVASKNGNLVSVIDLVSRQVREITSFPAGAEPVAVAVHPNQPEIYVANNGNDTVSLIDVSDLAQLAVTHVQVNESPVDIVLHPWANRLAVGHTDVKLAFVDLATAAVTNRPLGKPQDRLAFADFSTVDEVVSDVSQDLVDPEYDPRNNRIVWQDLNANSNMWVAQIDPQTAAIDPPDGKGIFVDDEVAPLVETLNGPEWAFGVTSTYIVYTDTNDAGQRHLAMATEVSDGVWVTDQLPNGQNRYSPLGTQLDGATNAQVAYLGRTPIGAKVLAYRDLDADPGTEILVGLTTSGAFWAQGKPAFTFGAKGAGGYQQVYLFDVTSGVHQEVTTDSGNKYFGAMWWAPEYGEFLIVSLVGNQALGIYRKIGGVWQQIALVSLPSIHPYLHSPEPFVAGGKSYISVVAAKRLGDGGSEMGTPTGDTEIWIAGISADEPFFRRVSSPTRFANRKDPESFSTTNGTVVLYSEKDPDSGNWLLRRAQTGL